jgi:hypothetical protein
MMEESKSTLGYSLWARFCQFKGHVQLRVAAGPPKTRSAGPVDDAATPVLMLVAILADMADELHC